MCRSWLVPNKPWRLVPYAERRGSQAPSNLPSLNGSDSSSPHCFHSLLTFWHTGWCSVDEQASSSLPLFSQRLSKGIIKGRNPLDSGESFQPFIFSIWWTPYFSSSRAFHLTHCPSQPPTRPHTHRWKYQITARHMLSLQASPFPPTKERC